MSEEEDEELGGPYKLPKSQLPIFDGISSGNVKFVLGLFKYLCQEDQEKNVVLAPFVVTHTLLTGLLFGTSGSTMDQIKKVLLVPEVTEEKHSEIRDMMVWVHFRQIMEGDTANGYPRPFGIFYDKNELIPRKYLRANKHMSSMRFLWSTGIPEENRRHLNYKKIQRDYEPDIPELATTEDINDSTVFAIITSHNYCNVRPFTFSEELKPEPKPFFQDDSEVEIPMVNRQGSYGYVDLDDPPIRVVEIPYPRHESSLFVVLPKEKNGLEAIVESLNMESMKNIFDSIKETKVDVTLPCFKFVQSYSLIDALKSVGLTDIFSPETADFSKMCEGGSEGGYVTAFRHHAIFEIDAEGQGKPWDDEEDDEKAPKPAENGAGDTEEDENAAKETQEAGETVEAQDEGETVETQEKAETEDVQKAQTEETAAEEEEAEETQEAEMCSELCFLSKDEGEIEDIPEEIEIKDIEDTETTEEGEGEFQDAKESQQEEDAEPKEEEVPEPTAEEESEEPQEEVDTEAQEEEAEPQEEVEGETNEAEKEAEETQKETEAKEEEEAEEETQEETEAKKEEEEVDEETQEEAEDNKEEAEAEEEEAKDEPKEEAEAEAKEEEVEEGTEVEAEAEAKEEEAEEETQEEAETKEEEANEETKEEAEAETENKEGAAESGKGDENASEEAEISFVADHPFMFFVKEKPSQFIHIIGRFHHLPEENQLS